MDPDAFTARRLGRATLELLDEALRWRGGAVLVALGLLTAVVGVTSRGAVGAVVGALSLCAGVFVAASVHWSRWSPAALRWWFGGVLLAQLVALVALVFVPLLR